MQFASTAVLSLFSDAKSPILNILYAAASLAVGIALSILLARLTKKFFVLLGKRKEFDTRRFNMFANVLSTIVRCVVLFLALALRKTIINQPPNAAY